MAKRIITPKKIDQYIHSLITEEKSPATIEKYRRDLMTFYRFTGNTPLTKKLVIDYKADLQSRYAVRSVNSMLAAVNGLLLHFRWQDLRVKTIKIQRQLYCPEERELSKKEYDRLCHTARKKRNDRLELIIQTICGTGIRVSELSFITVEAAKSGKAVVQLKGKTRVVFIIRPLQKKLLRYAAERKITSGMIFTTNSGKAICRCNIWREMKKLCLDANVDSQKVFPHNLRHLFARVFYAMERDVAKLADILGHSSIETTRIYIISSGYEHRQRMEQMRLVI